MVKLKICLLLLTFCLILPLQACSPALRPYYEEDFDCTVLYTEGDTEVRARVLRRGDKLEIYLLSPFLLRDVVLTKVGEERIAAFEGAQVDGNAFMGIFSYAELLLPKGNASRPLRTENGGFYICFKEGEERHDIYLDGDEAPTRICKGEKELFVGDFLLRES